MAKQMYIDENGNEQLVSGTINTADMLPIESGSATNTKAYIDSLASVTSSIISESNPYISVVKAGKICVVRVNTQNYTVTQGTIGTLPVGFRPASTFVSRSYRGENNYIGISGSLIESDNAPKYTAMSFTFYQEE